MRVGGRNTGHPVVAHSFTVLGRAEVVRLPAVRGGLPRRRFVAFDSHTGTSRTSVLLPPSNRRSWTPPTPPDSPPRPAAHPKPKLRPRVVLESTQRWVVCPTTARSWSRLMSPSRPLRSEPSSKISGVGMTHQSEAPEVWPKRAPFATSRSGDNLELCISRASRLRGGGLQPACPGVSARGPEYDGSVVPD